MTAAKELMKLIVERKLDPWEVINKSVASSNEMRTANGPRYALSCELTH